mgnify:CR=1 FL=1
MNKKIVDVIIIGGGLSGSYLSFKLKKHGYKVLIIEKSKGIGGRMCTKPVGGNLVDYGCQYITPKTDILLSILSNLEQKSVVKRIKIDHKDAFISSYGMNKIPQYLSLGVPTLTSSFAERLEYKKNYWVTYTPFSLYRSRFIVLTMPINQVHMLLKNSNISTHELPNVEFEEFFTATFKGNSNNQKNAFNESKSFPWICNNTLKGLRNTSDIFTVNLSSKLSKKYHQIDPKQRTSVFQGLLKENGFKHVSHLSLHYWKYAYSSKQNNISHTFDENINLGICGDSFSTGKVDGAVQSSHKLYQDLLSSI